MALVTRMPGTRNAY